jgi:hypothetical protein
VIDVLADLGPGVLDDGAVGRVDALDVEALEPAQRVEVVAEVAVLPGMTVVEPPRITSP